MKSKPTPSIVAAEMRRHAESRLRDGRKGQQSKAEVPKSAADTRRLLHELQVYQIELEMQNEELRKTRDEMETERDKYSDLYDFAPVGYLTLDREGTISEANLAGASLLGVARAALVKRRFGAFVSPMDRSAFAAFLQQVFKSKAREECDVRLLLKGTDAVVVRIRAIASGNGYACQMAMSDITERKLAEEKMLESEERFRVMANAMPQLAWIARPDGHIFWYNQRWYDYTGTIPKQMEGWGWQSVHDAVELPKVLKRWKASLATGEPFDMTFPLRGADGIFRSFLTRVIPMKNAADRVVQWFGTNTDVTEQKLADDKVRVSETRYRRLFETAHDGVLVLDPATRKITDANPFMSQLLGYPHRQLVGKELFEIGLFKDESASREMFRKLKLTHIVRYEDLPLKSGDGRHHEVEVVANLYMENGHAVIQCNIRDISARKQVERELFEKARLLDLSHDAIIVRDMEGHIRYWNHGAEELYGWSRHEVLGKVSHILLQTEFLVPLEQITEQLHRSNRWIGELVHTTRDGRRLTVLARKTLDRDQHGNPASVLENISDITERKKAEEAVRVAGERFHFMAKSMPQKIFTATATGEVDYFNQQWMEFTGLTFEEIRDWGWTQFIHPDDLEENLRLWKRSVETGEYFEMEHRFRRHDGEYRWHVTRAHAMRDAEGKITMWIGSNTDIHNMMEAQEELIEAEAQLADRAVHLEALVAERTHDLTAAHIQLLTDADERKRLETEIASTIESERARLGQELHDGLVQELTGIGMMMHVLAQALTKSSPKRASEASRLCLMLEQSHGNARDLAKSFYPVELEQYGLVAALEEIAQRAEKQSGISCVVQADENAAAPAKDAITSVQLFRIAQEAVQNACKHAQATEILIYLSKRGGAWLLTVKDNGTGLPDNRLKDGGMGLRIMQYRARIIGGKLSVSNAEDGGVIVSCSAPAGDTDKVPAGKIRKRLKS